VRARANVDDDLIFRRTQIHWSDTLFEQVRTTMALIDAPIMKGTVLLWWRGPAHLPRAFFNDTRQTLRLSIKIPSPYR